jgi:polyisoprenoid-binding protein YceI
MLRQTVSAFTLAAVTVGAEFVFHPGKSWAEPRLASTAPTPIQGKARYTVDPMHCSVGFEITHLGLSKTMGLFDECSGTILLDEKDLAKSSVEFRVKVASIDTGVPARDEHLLKPDFFEVEKYPEMKFVSKEVKKMGQGYVVIGDLTMKDKTKTISIPFKHYGPLKLTMGAEETRIGVVADPITIRRSDFGIGNQFKLPDGTEGASDAVTVRLSFEAILQKGEG